MSKIAAETRNNLKTLILEAMGKAVADGQLAAEPIPAFLTEAPADRSNGDLATNAAMACAKAFRLPPRKIAEIIKENLCLDGTYFEKCEIAGPGFINFFFNDEYYSDILKDIRNCGSDYGKSGYGKGKRVMVEFVSANPTGPMHMGNARGGALGDCLAAVLDYAGYKVQREFYINDAGNQIEKFALSLEVRYLQKYLGEDAVKLPEDCYQGEDIRERAYEFAEIHGDKYVNAHEKERRDALVDFALVKNIDDIHKTLEKYRIEYDVWFKESDLHNSGEVQQTIDILKNNGYTYEKDGALWYKNIKAQTQRLLRQGKTQEEIDRLLLKDDVLIRANGNPTYFAADIAYHRNKLEKRGFDKVINVWGADHHGHVARLKCALDAIGLDGDKLDVVLMQLVRLVSGGEVVRMSKRTGKAVSLTDLLEDIPVDAARFLFNMRDAGSQMEFDLDLAVEQSAQNPVYYCQYAHARICSILKKLSEQGVNINDCPSGQLNLLKEPEERELIRHMSLFTDVIISAAEKYEPAAITHYAAELAAAFHKFYNAHRVNTENKELMQARIFLCLCVRDTIGNILKMLKIDAPESM